MEESRRKNDNEKRIKMGNKDREKIKRADKKRGIRKSRRDRGGG